jgi:ABC-type spermidine/putrescine transport system permease subunit II
VTALALRLAWTTTRRILLVGVAVFLLLPTVFIFPLALNSGSVLSFPPEGLSLRHVRAVLSSPTWRGGFLTSFEVGALAALMATVLGTACALLFPGFRRGIRTPLEMLAVSPFVVPPIVLAVAWFSLFAQLHMVGTTLAVAIGHALLGLPVVYLNVSAALATLDGRLVLAGRSLGASKLTALARIVLPLIAPGVVAGALLTFVLSMDELIISLFVGGGIVGTLPVVMWAQINYVATPEIAAAAALTVVLSITGLGLAAFSWRLMRGRGHAR